MKLNSTCLVAGGAGFLGQHLVKSLLDQGSRIVCVDNLTTAPLENALRYSEVEDYSFYKVDITDAHFDAFLKKIGSVNYVYNLASPASPPKYQADPLGTLQTNYVGTRNLLEFATQQRAVFFQASTSEVYGDPTQHPQCESYFGNVNAFGPRSCYDEGKRVAEALCFAYAQERATDIRIARIFNTYGPGMQVDDGRAVSNFVTQALSGSDITIYGDGHQTRSFCYVDDLIDGILGLTQSETPIYGPLNLGNPHEVSLLEVAHKIQDLIGSRSRICHVASAKDDPTQRCPDITRAQTLLNWHPKTPLNDGLQRTIEYFRNVLSTNAAIGS